MMILATFAAAAAPAAVVVRNKTQKYYSLAHSPLRLPGSADKVSWNPDFDGTLLHLES